MALLQTLTTPAPISSLVCIGHLFAGSDDGSLRVYDLLSWKATRAIRGLPAEISSVVSGQSGDVWLAAGRSAYAFSMSITKLVQTIADATMVLELGADEDDVLNELALNPSKTHLAFSTDSGSVGVVDIATKSVSRMKTQHTSICGLVRFIPDRPREIVSGGYDSALLHFDYMLGSTLSRRDFTADPATQGVSLSPPFIMSAALSTTGAMAAGTADGRLWLGTGGDKGALAAKSTKKKRSRKWEGLNADDEILEKAAEGPLVAMAFAGSSTLVVSTLLGNIMHYTASRNDADELQLSKTAEFQSGVSKVNALVHFDEKNRDSRALC
ncbi:hypothetical protein MKEN_01209800 [Mycena kentingensis (nom. inval.)]|nr:hypothetical protein MKEN_01209800 [Mycena kentingensis (nom. inval.)]